MTLSRTFVSLGQRDFRYLILSSMGLGLGQWIQQVGLGWLILQVTQSPAQMGLLAGVRGVTLLIFSPVGGILSDRTSRRTIIVISTLVGAGQAAILAALVALELTEVWHLYLFTLIEGVATGVNQPARQAFVYDVVVDRETLTNAIALNSVAQNMTRVVGPSMAGVLIGLFGVSSCFIILAALKGISAWLTLLISATAGLGIARKEESVIESLTGSVAYAFKDSTILGLVAVSTIPTILIYPYVGFLPVFSDRVFHAGAQGYGLLASGVGLGSIFGGLALASLGNIGRKGITMLVTLLIYNGFVILFSLTNGFFLAMSFLIIAGIFHSVSTALTNIILQLVVRDEMRGRMMALNSMAHGLQPLGALPMGAAMEVFGAPNTVAVFASVGAVLILALTATAPQLRRA